MERLSTIDSGTAHWLFEAEDNFVCCVSVVAFVTFTLLLSKVQCGDVKKVKTYILNFRLVLKKKFAGFLKIRIVHDGKANVCLTTMNHVNLKKACEFLFLELDGSSELTSPHCT